MSMNLHQREYHSHTDYNLNDCEPENKCIKTTENSRKPYLSIKYVYNGCKGHRNSGDRALNCLEYAFFVPNSADKTLDDMLSSFKDRVKKKPEEVSVEEALSVTKNYMTVWLNNMFGDERWREVNSCDDYVASNEWMVCMRVGVHKYVDSGSYDYHFWYRTSTGKWYNKHGTEASEPVKYTYSSVKQVIDPSTTDIVDGWAKGSVEQYYNSKTVYYVVKSKTGGGIGDEQK